MMDINRRLQALVPAGSAGGCLDPAAYWNARPRVLWVLKETNGVMGRSLPHFLQAEMDEGDVWGRIWRMVGACSNGIHEGRLDFSADHPMAGDSSRAYRGLTKIAVTNVKKTPGKGTAHPDVLWEWMRTHYREFCAELAILQPDLVICGGTWDLVAGWIGYRHGVAESKCGEYWSLNLNIDVCGDVFGFHPRGGGLPVVAAPHPAARGRVTKTYRQTVGAALWALGRRVP